MQFDPDLAPTPAPELSRGRWRDGQTHPRLRLEVDAPRRPGTLAREPENRHPHHADLPPADLARLGRRADLSLQRRLSLDHRWQAPGCAGKADAGGLARDPERHRAPAVEGARRRRGHLCRRAAPGHGAQRLSGRNLLHFLLHPVAGGQRVAGRHHLRQHRRHEAGRRRAAVAPPARARRERARRPLLAGGLPAERARARERPARRPLRPALHEAAGLRDLVPVRIGRLRRAPSRRPSRHPADRRPALAAHPPRWPGRRILRRSRRTLRPGAAGWRLGQGVRPRGHLLHPRQRAGPRGPSDRRD